MQQLENTGSEAVASITQSQANVADRGDPPQRSSNGRAKIRTVYRAGDFSCIGEDVARLTSPHAWLSGDGLSVFARAQHSAANVADVSVCHSRLLYDVAYLDDLNADGGADDARRIRAMEPITDALGKVRCCSQ